MSEARELVDAIVPTKTIEDDEDTTEHLIDSLADAAASIEEALQVVIDSTNDDERVLL